MAEGWHFFATNLDRAGSEVLAINDLELSGSHVTMSQLSGPGGLTGTIPVEQARLKGSDGLPLLRPWQSCVYAELGGVIRGGGVIADDIDLDEPQVSLSCKGFSAYPTGQPYKGDKWWAMADPFDIAREFWSDVQSQPRSNIGLDVVFSPAATPVRLGRLPVEKWPQIHDGYPGNPLPAPGTRFVLWWTENGKRKERYGVATRTYGKPRDDGNVYYVLRERSDGSVTEDDTGDGVPAGYDVLGVVDARTKKPTVDSDGEQLQPYRLNEYDTLDMGEWWTTLCKDGGFDYYETHAWAASANRNPNTGDPVDIKHTLHVGYPTVGRNLRTSTEHRFEIGENVSVVPTVSLSADDYCDEVLVVGAGEGPAKVRGRASVSDQGRLHRTKTISDPSIKTNALALKRAAQEASQYAGDQNISELKVRNHSFAQLGSYGAGDTIQVFGSGKGWAADLDLSFRITQITVSPDEGDVATVTGARPDKISNEV